MKKVINYLLLVVYGLLMAYLCLPSPRVPDLANSLKSAEAGDTVEITGVAAYFTDTPRSEVVAFYRQAFSRSSFLNLPLPTVVLNHPPEYAEEVLRATAKSTFLYELVHPFRESLFISGWDPEEDPIYKRAKAPDQAALRSQHLWQPKTNRYYERKITLRVFNSFFLWRLIIFNLGLALLVKIFLEGKRILASFWRQRR